MGLLSIYLLLVFGIFGCKENTKYSSDTHKHSFQADKYAKMFESDERTKWQKPNEVISLMNIKNGNYIADIGAGTGYFTRRFARAVGINGKAIGFDIEPSMVKYMKRDANKLGLKNYEAVLVNANSPNLGRAFNIIFMCNTYHHITNRVDYFKRLKLFLNKNGRLVIVDFMKKSLPVGPPLDYKLSRAYVEKELNKAGYRLINHKELTYQYYLEFKSL